MPLVVGGVSQAGYQVTQPITLEMVVKVALMALNVATVGHSAVAGLLVQPSTISGFVDRLQPMPEFSMPHVHFLPLASMVLRCLEIIDYLPYITRHRPLVNGPPSLTAERTSTVQQCRLVMVAAIPMTA